MHELLLGLGKKPEFVPPAPVPGTPYKGFVKSADLFTGQQLASLVGLTGGQHFAENNDAGWLHYIDEGREFYIARKTLRTGVPEAAYSAAGQISGKQIVFGGNRYLVRNMTVFTENPWVTIRNNALVGGEWNKYMYPVYGGTDRLPEWPVWSSYTALELGIDVRNSIPQRGACTVGCERNKTSPTYLSARGERYDTLSGIGSPAIATQTFTSTDASSPETQPKFGWRPIVELLGPVIVDPDSGPGPTTIQHGDKQSGYFGITNTSELFTVEEIEALSAVPLVGTPINRDDLNLWVKYAYDGKILFIPKRIVRSGMTWNNLYLSGLMFGTNDNGTTQTGGQPDFKPLPLTPTNQYRTLTKTTPDGTVWTFKVRNIRTCRTDPSGDWGTPANNTATEYSNTVERAIPATGIDQVWATNDRPSSSMIVGTETWAGGTDYVAYCINPNNSVQAFTRTQSTKYNGMGWLPVVELVSFVKP